MTETGEPPPVHNVVRIRPVADLPTHPPSAAEDPSVAEDASASRRKRATG